MIGAPKSLRLRASLSRRGSQVDGRPSSNGGGLPARAAATPRRSRRLGGPPQDRALYACSCGLAFDALVSTSVDCPGCGSPQAW